MTLPTEVSGFADFWRAQRQMVASHPTLAAITAEPARRRHRVSGVEWRQSGNLRVGGWLCEPLLTPTCAVVVGHGYGGRGDADPGCLPPEAVGLFPCMLGFDRSADPTLPDSAERHVVHGIAQRDTYILRDCVEAIWRSFDVLSQRFPQLPLGFIGSSFSGGLGALALPWESRCRAAVLEVPTFGNHPLRLTIPCTGSGEAVRQYHRDHPEVVDVLAWYDAAVAARHLHCPTLIAPADRDPVVPAPGQWSVAEATPQAVIHRLSAGHPTPAREAAQAWKAYRHFISAQLSAPRLGASG